MKHVRFWDPLGVHDLLFLVFLVKDDDLEDLDKSGEFMDEIIGLY